MNEPDRTELEQLKRQVEDLQRQQEALRLEVKTQDEFLSDLAQRLDARLDSSRATLAAAPPKVDLPEAPVSTSEPVATHRPSPPALPPVIPSVLTTEVLRESARSRRTPEATTVAPTFAAAPAPVAETIPPPEPTFSTPAEGASFEMRLGTYWLVRIGIVMLLTGLVFFGNYAYQNFIGKLGPVGKVTLLYLAGGVLLGVGGWLQRRQVNESLKNYGQVVFAGGLAAVYFVTYAAHYFPPLAVISSALVDGVLLFCWAAFIVVLADWKKSEVLALFAIGLAYYASAISEMKAFTLFSNLVLTAAAVFFLVRNRWVKVSFVSLVATYLGYGFWRFYHGNAWGWDNAASAGDYWTGNLFLAGYWLLFTAAVFLSRHEALAFGRRATFLSLNNGAYFALAILTSTHAVPLWSFTLGFGVVLLALALVAKRVFPEEEIVADSYLTQGLLFVTLGLIFKFTGTQLGLILAAESVALLVLGVQRRNQILRAGAYVAALLSIAWGASGILDADPQGWSGRWLGVTIGALLLFNAVWLRRDAGTSDPASLCPQRSYFTILGLGIWLLTTQHFASREWFGLILAGEAIACTASYYLIRVREVAVFGQGYLILAQLGWFGKMLDFGAPHGAVPWWNAVLMIAATVALSHWWQRQKVMAIGEDTGRVLQGVYGLAVVGILYLWLHPKFAVADWLAITSLLAVAVTIYGLLTRAWLLAAVGQLFLVASAVEFFRQLFPGSPDYAPPDWRWALVPIGASLSLPVLAAKWLTQPRGVDETVGQSVNVVGLAYRIAAVLMSLQWVQAYIPGRERFWVLTLVGGLLFLWGGWRRNQPILGFSAVYTSVGLVHFWADWTVVRAVYWPDLLAIFLLLTEQQVARRSPGGAGLKPAWHGAIIVAGGLSLWLFVSRLVFEGASGFYLTAAWAALALVIFAAGFGLRERAYRWLGLVVLAAALGRVVLFDVWKLETVYRILSFMALGVVLLVLGFIYNKFQEKIREWL